MDLSINIHNMHRPVLLYYLSWNTCHNCPRNRWINQSIYVNNMHKPVLLHYLSSNICHSCPGNRWINQSICILCTSPYCFTTSHQILVSCHSCPRNGWIYQSLYILCTGPYCFTTSHQIFVTTVLEIYHLINRYAYYVQARTASGSGNWVESTW